MEATLNTQNQLDKLNHFFSTDVACRGTRPLKKGTEISLYLDESGPFRLVKNPDKMIAESKAPSRPDLSLWLPNEALNTLSNFKGEGIGELGVEIIKLMSHEDPKLRTKVEVKVGMLKFLSHGYLGILPLGGSTLMKFLGSKGLTGMGKIKQAIDSLRRS